MFFDSWFSLIRILVIGVLTYFTIVAILRMSGKRTLAQLNAFDFIITVALGSTVASIILSTDVTYSEGLLALGLLACLQFVVARASSNNSRIRRIVTSPPALLVRDGEPLLDVIHTHRLSVAGVEQAIRQAGYGGFDQIFAVILESNGQLSVIPHSNRGDGSALTNLY
ncbi:DUF421 domain-containing protein [Corynebacterium sp. ES2775-CONJ]|uniref:DUF421 domain-containing protein n=1 Tax=Corynebacterium sp. ES2775-CONJ TaxID=2974029 RepID=UPI002166D0E2|nr:YetF domain-containing protein [Corynebacterium sp. ES2775-CONJ]MCS4489758.1 DUF421 domain-containing protein [Corynebacterium sp. ES2775-CONJ]